MMMKVMMMVMMMIMVGNFWSQNTDDGFTDKEQITQSESGNLLVLFRFSS
jgi:hypothetical protein